MKAAATGLRVFSVIVLWGLACSGWASVQPHERTGMIVGSIPNGTQAAEDRDSAVATITRTLVSMMIGETIARSMDDTDRTMVLHTLENGRGGVPSRWRNPDSHNMYTVTLIRAYDVAQGPCLEYTVEAVIGGKGDKVHSTACLRSDGSWDVANDD